MKPIRFSVPSSLDIQLWLKQTKLWFWINLALLIVVIGLCGYLIPSVKQDSLHIMQQIQAARSNSLIHSNHTLLSSTPRMEVDRFYRSLDSSQEYSATLKELFSLSRRLALDLTSGDYKLTLSEDKKIVTHEINLPITGTYPQIKDFALTALKEHPNLSLVSMKLNRESTNLTTVQVTLRFHLFVYRQAK